MKWLKKLEDLNTSFHVHALNKEDFILLEEKKKNRHMVYILEGCTQMLRVFTNSEKVCLRILSKSEIIVSYYDNEKTENYCDLMVAATKTKIVIIPFIEIKNKLKGSTEIFAKRVVQKESAKDEIINILSHRNTKKRVVQLLIVLTKRLGYIKDNKIIIPIRLTHQVIADIIGSQRIAVSRVMASLKRSKIIEHNNKSFTICSATRLIQI